MRDREKEARKQHRRVEHCGLNEGLESDNERIALRRRLAGLAFLHFFYTRQTSAPGNSGSSRTRKKHTVRTKERTLSLKVAAGRSIAYA